MGGRLGLHVNELSVLDGQEKSLISMPKKLECELCKENKQAAKNNKDKDKTNT